MKTKLRPSICYMAGLSKRMSEKNMICIVTGIDGIEQRFIEMAVKEFKIVPSKIVIEQKEDGRRKVYFYHSRIARQLEEIRAREEKLFKVPNEFALNYLAGMVDSSARFSKQGIYLEALTPQDEVMLANLGLHTRNGRVSNLSTLIKFAAPYSILLKRLGQQ